MRKLLKCTLFWSGGGLILALTVATALQWWLSHRALERNPPPGEMIDVGERRIHLLCQGKGSPAVILESGIPGTSLGWTLVMEDIASFARVCAYDRARIRLERGGGRNRVRSATSPESSGNCSVPLRWTRRTSSPATLSGAWSCSSMPAGSRTKWPEWCWSTQPTLTWPAAPGAWIGWAVSL